MLKKTKVRKDKQISGFNYYFELLFWVTMTILILDGTGFPGTMILRKIKYVYIIALVLRVIIKKKIVFSKNILCLLGLLLLHTVIFGVLCINQSVSGLIHSHFREVLTYLIVVYLTAQDIIEYKWWDKSIEYLFISSIVFIVWNIIKHPHDFVNPVLYIYALSKNARIRSAFTMGDCNYAGSYFLLCILICLLKIKTSLPEIRKRISNRLLIFGILIIEICMLFSTGSRTSILGFLLFLFFYTGLYIWKEYHKYYRKGGALDIVIIIGMLFIIVCLYSFGIGDKIMNESQRLENWTINFPIFKDMNAWKMGMGYIESSGFLTKAYGLNTWPCDSFYFYIFFTTGIIGSVLMGMVLIGTLFCLIRQYLRLSTRNEFAIALFMMMLFAGFSEVNIITYRFFSCTIYWIIIFYSILSNDKKRIAIGL